MSASYTYVSQSARSVEWEHVSACALQWTDMRTRGACSCSLQIMNFVPSFGWSWTTMHDAAHSTTLWRCSNFMCTQHIYTYTDSLITHKNYFTRKLLGSDTSPLMPAHYVVHWSHTCTEACENMTCHNCMPEKGTKQPWGVWVEGELLGVCQLILFTTFPTHPLTHSCTCAKYV